MSLQTTLARGEVRHWETEMKLHVAHCSACRPRRGRGIDLCQAGLAIDGTLKIARGSLKAEREADKAPIEGQGSFDFD